MRGGRVVQAGGTPQEVIIAIQDRERQLIFARIRTVIVDPGDRGGTIREQRRVRTPASLAIVGQVGFRPGDRSGTVEHGIVNIRLVQPGQDSLVVADRIGGYAVP